jgi:ribonuclease HI
MTAKTFSLYADGSCYNYEHLGGWAFIALADGKPEHAGYSSSTIRSTTSNKMEIMAATMALEWAIKSCPTSPVRIISDSQYTINGASKWLANWIANGWMTWERKPVANRLEWKRLAAAKASLERSSGQLTWQWVKGHSSNFWNKAADHLATYNMPEAEKQLVVDGLIRGSIHSTSHPFRQ